MPDITGKRVLIFGDSLSTGAGSPGFAMGAELAKHGAKVFFDTRIGRSANNFFAREDYGSKLSAGPYDVVIVQLGTNDIGLSMQVDGERMARIRDAFAKHADVWAFGPPSFATDVSEHAGAPAVVGMMQSVFGRKFIDLRTLSADLTTTGRASDGVHFTAAGGQVLGGRMAKTFMNSESAGALPVVIAIGLLVATYFLAR